MENKNIGKKIEDRRKELGYTLERLADDVGVTRSTVLKYEKGQIIPTLDKIEKIAKALNISPSVLMGWNTQETAHKIWELSANNQGQYADYILKELEKENIIEKRREKEKLYTKIYKDIFNILKTDVKEYFKIYCGENLTSDEIKKLHEDILKYINFLLGDLKDKKTQK